LYISAADTAAQLTVLVMVEVKELLVTAVDDDATDSAPVVVSEAVTT
jgi:hypothetical protein